ncbi:saccharopine dehydrogenase family protein [Enemella sp. A6]|uniref:saccharopine dehydrogenase family protein n=1 Tax=Enemella sp. A6 TaxID=3440152 RepID=UPI003EBCA240
MQITVLGAGGISRGIAAELSRRISAGELPGCSLTVADIDVDRARTVAGEVGAEARQVDITDPEALAALVADCDLVASAVGPFSRFGSVVLRACVAAGTHYLDVCDEDVVAAEVLLDADLDRAAAAADATVVIGCGATPGISNVVARWGIESLDVADSVDIFLGIPPMASFGVTINEHMLDSLSGQVTQYLDGRFEQVDAWTGTRDEQMAEGYGGGSFGYLGHPEPLCLGRSYPDLQRATIRWSWLEPEANETWQLFNRLGLNSDEPVPSLGLSPRTFLAHLLDSPQGARIPGLTPQRSHRGVPLRTIVEGTLDQKPTRVVLDQLIEWATKKGSPGAETAWPAAETVARIATGAITRRGVLSPEQVLDPDSILPRYAEVTGVSFARSIETTGKAWLTEG